jgi:hypothetical protein
MATKRTRKNVSVLETEVPQSAEEKHAENSRTAYIAYNLFLSRGGVQGYEIEDWLKAEQLLAEGRRTLQSIEKQLLEKSESYFQSNV